MQRHAIRPDDIANIKTEQDALAKQIGANVRTNTTFTGVKRFDGTAELAAASVGAKTVTIQAGARCERLIDLNLGPAS